MSTPRPNAELPPPSPELVLIVALVRGYLRTLPRKERRQFVRYVADTLALEVGEPNVIRLRPASQDGDVMDAKLKAEAYWDAIRALLIPLLAED